MGKYGRVFFCTIILLLITVACIHNEVAFENEKPELVFQPNGSRRIYGGIAHIYTLSGENILVAKFNPTDSAKVDFLGYKNNPEPGISEIDCTTMNKKVRIHQGDYAPKNKSGYPYIYDFKFIDRNTMTCVIEDLYQTRILNIDLDTRKSVSIPNKCGIKGSQYFHFREISVMSSRTTELTINDSKNDPCEITYSGFDSSRINKNDYIFRTDVGRNRNELIFWSTNRERKSIFEKEENKIIFYAIKEDKIEKTIILPDRANNNPSIRFDWGWPYILPNLEEILFIGNGLWLYNLKTNELLCLIWGIDYFHLYYSLKDISWDSKRILFMKLSGNLGSKLFVIDIEEFLRYQPNGCEMFF